MTFSPGPAPRTVRAADGQVLDVPAGWELLPSGDAALMRRVKAAGDHWVVAEKKGRKVFSQGIWAPAATIQRIREQLEAERAEPAFPRRKADARTTEKPRRKPDGAEITDGALFRADLTVLKAEERSWSAKAASKARAAPSLEPVCHP